MSIELSHKVKLNWQVVEKPSPHPDPYFELRQICTSLFNQATETTLLNPIRIPIKSMENVYELKELTLKNLQLNIGNSEAENILKSILNGHNPQYIIASLNNFTDLSNYNLWEIMRQIAEFQSNQTPDLYLSILGNDMQKL